MPDLDFRSPDQRLALKTAAKNLGGEFAGVFGAETIELFLQTSTTSSPIGRSSPTSCRSWPSGSPSSG